MPDHVTGHVTGQTRFGHVTFPRSCASKVLESRFVTADAYINKFIELAEAAQWGLDALGTIRLFRDGLPLNLHRAIYQYYRPLPCTMQQWFDATREEVRRYKDMVISLGQKGGKGTSSTRQNRLKALQLATERKPKDPNAMDVDVIKSKKLLDEERAKLLKERRCFRCKKMGHLSRNCPDKGKKDKEEKDSKPRNNSRQFTKPKAHTATIEEETSDKEEEDKKEPPPSYTNKGILEYMRTMKLADREEFFEHLASASQGF